MTRRPVSWLNRIKPLAETLARNATEPVTFLLGAGASISSDAPSNGEVERTLLEGFEGHFDSLDALYAKAHRITDYEMRSMLADRFEQLVPYIGYRALAALARSRRVVVVNLNWDRAVESACSSAGVPCASFDIHPPDRSLGARRELHRDMIEAVQSVDPGVVVLHVHGTFGDDGGGEIRFGTAETLTLSAENTDLLSRCFAATTIVLGTSLRASDYDNSDILATLGIGPRGVAQRPLWFFSRQDGSSSEAGEHPAAAALHSRRSEMNFVGGPAVDFDRLMVTLLARDRGRRWDDLLAKATQVSLPDWHRLVYPEPGVLRDRLDHRVVLLTGEGLLGKTTVAHVLAHWKWLLADDDASTEGIRRVETDRVLETLVDAADPAALGPSVLIAEDPYGREGDEENPEVARRLAEATERDTGPIIIVTSRAGPWESAVEAPLELTRSSATDWYGHRMLEEYAERLEPGAGRQLAGRIRDGELTTPYFVELAVRGVDHPTDSDQVVKGFSDQLSRWWADPAKRGLVVAVVAVRLQEFAHVRPPFRIADPLDLDREVVIESDLRIYLHEYRLDGKRWWRPRHPTIVSAVDRFLTEPTRPHATGAAAVREELEPLGRHMQWVRAALDAHSEVIALSEDDVLIPVVRDDRDIGERAPTMLAAAAKRSPEAAWGLVESVQRSDPDFWTMAELTRSVIRQARSFRSETRIDRFVGDIARDRAHRGAYLLLEAASTTGNLLDGRLLPVLQTTLLSLRAHPDPPSVRREIASCFDGLCWRAGPWTAEERTRMLGWLLDAAERDRPLWGSLAMACAYHPAVLDVLSSGGLRNPLTMADALTPEQATEVQWLTDWHYVHQSRARVLVGRRGFEPEDMPYMERDRSRERASRVQQEAIDRMTRALLEYPEHFGTAAHLVTSVTCVAGEVACDEVADALQSRAMPDADASLITTAIGYPVAPNGIRTALGDYLRRPPNRAALLDRLGSGTTFEGAHVTPPRFRPAEDAHHLLDRFGFTWPRLRRAGWEGESLLRRLMLDAGDWADNGPPAPKPRRTAGLAADEPLDQEQIDRFVVHARRTSFGDLRAVEAHVAPARSDDGPVDVLTMLDAVARQD